MDKEQIRRGRRRRRASRIVAEALEGRTLLTATVVSGGFGTQSSAPRLFADVGGMTYFTTTSGTNALWKTDPQTGQTELVRDFGATAGNRPTDLTAGGGLLYFVAGGAAGRELWKSDGTAGGTVMVKDIIAGATGSFPASLTYFNGKLYFAATDSTSGSELWKSDGTDAGTARLVDIASGPASSVPHNMLVFNDMLYFAASDQFGGDELWRTEGTAAGTAPVMDIYPGTTGSAPAGLTVMGGLFYFSANSPSFGRELWRSGGMSANTTRVADVNSGSSSSSPADFAVVNGALYFTATTSASGRELWRSDGTIGSASLVKDIRSGGDASPTNLVAAGGKVYFSANDGVTQALWASDGSGAGTVKLPAAVSPAFITPFGGRAWFAATDAASGTELWSSDGTVGGTAVFKDVAPGAESGAVGTIGVAGPRLYFAAYQYGTGEELWATDGAGAAALVKDLNTAPLAAVPGKFVEFAGNVLFTTSAGGLYATDGTPGGAARLSYLTPSNFCVVGNVLYFTVGEGTRFPAVWKIDATLSGIQLVKSFTMPVGVTAGINTLAAYKGKLMFYSGFSAAPGEEIWISDGTDAGTTPLQGTADANRVRRWKNPVQIGDTLYFYGWNSNSGWELWRTDGTAAGTTLVKDVQFGGAGSAFDSSGNADLEDLNGTLIYAPLSGQYNRELWRSDGTAAGTSMVVDIDGTVNASIQVDPDPVSTLVRLGNYVYFFSGTSLWRTDGTAAGTAAVAPVDPGDVNVRYGLTRVGNRLFFVKQHGPARGEYQLWTSDGTAAGTTLLRRFYVDASSTAPGVGPIADVSGVAYFAGWNVTEGGGVELWRSDGTVAGTMVAANVNPGIANANPTSLTPVGSSLYFAADFGATGSQVWRERAPSGPPAPAGLTLAAPSPFRVTLDWSAIADNGVSFRIERSLTGDFAKIDDAFAAPPGSSTFADPVALANTHYYYRVVAVNAAGESAAATGDVTTPATAFPVGVTRVDPTFTASMRNPFTFRGQVYLNASYPGDPAAQAYRSDGQDFVRIAPYAIDNPVFLNDRMYFLATGGVWVSDGTAANTVLAIPSDAGVFNLSQLDGRLYFGRGSQLWSSDGTAAGTGVVDYAAHPRLAVLYKTTFTTSPIAEQDSAVLNGNFYYVSSADQQVHRISGDEDTAITSVAPRSIGGWTWSPNRLAAVNGYLYFFGGQYEPELTNKFVLYRSDGTPEGTVRMNVVGAGKPGAITAANGTIFFVAGGALWASDGTEAGTVAIKPYPVVGLNVAITELKVVAGRLYFNYHYPTGDGTVWTGELWTSDGTVAGTVKIAGLPNTTSAGANSPAFLADGGDALYFLADLSTALGQTGKLFRYAPPPAPVAIPDAPTDLVARPASAGQVTLAWTDNARNEEGYRVERSTSPSFATLDKSVTLLPNVAHYVDLGLAPATTYYYRVAAFNTGGATAAVVVGPATTPVGPAAPTGLTLVEVVKGERVDLAWVDASGDETGFVVERSTAFDFFGPGVVRFDLAAGATAFADTTVARLTKYYYRVYAAGPAGNSAAAVAFLATSEAKPLPPSGLRAWGVSATQIDLQWTDVAVNESVAGGYTVERAGQDGVYAAVASLPQNSTTYSDRNLQPGQFFTYRVRAVNAINPSIPVVSAVARTLPPNLTTTVAQLPTLPGSSQPLSADPSRVVPLGGKGFFIATDGSTARPVVQLWVTDGTADNTALVKSYFPGAGRIVGVAGNLLYFVVSDEEGLTSLYRTDGTTAGTIAVQFLYDLPPGGQADSPYEAIDFGGALCFLMVDPARSGGSLYRTDGTAAGTAFVKNFPNATPGGLVVRNGALYFAVNGAHYKTDGTAAGTAATADFVPGLGATERVTDGAKTYFVVGNQLFVNDGTPGGDTLLVTAAVDTPSRLRVVNGKLFFITRSWDSGQTQKYSDLYVTDGTPGGTTLIKQFQYGGAAGVWEVQKLGNALYLNVNDFQYMELWRTDGTAAGTVRIERRTSYLDRLGVAGNYLTYRGAFVTQLQSTSGEVGASTQITKIGSLTAHPDWLTAVGNDLYFVSSFLSSPGDARLASGVEVWKTNSITNQSTRLFVGSARDLKLHDGILYFISKAKLYRIDPADDVPVVVKDFGAGYDARIVTAANGILYVGVGSGGNGTHYVLWRTDGTPGGTVPVGANTQLFLNITNDTAQYFASSGGYLYFLDGDNGGTSNGGSLWRTDGTAVAKIPGIIQVESLRDVNGTLFAVGRHLANINAISLCTVDHAAATLTPIKALVTPDFYPSGVARLTAVGDKLYFGAPAAGQGVVLWSSDGTAAGTAPFLDPYPDNSPGANNGRIDAILDVGGGAAYVIAYDDVANSGSLWRTDGTAAGSAYVRAVNRPKVSPYGARPLFLTSVNGLVVYSDGDYLWRSDGTTTGTVQIDQTGLAADGTRPLATWGGAAYAAVGDRLYFTGPIPGTGRDLRVAYLAKPESPRGLAVADAGPLPDGPVAAASTGIKLTWQDRSATESAFVVERSTTPDFAVIDRTFFADANATSFTDPSASIGDHFYYRVRAVNAGGDSSDSNLITAGAPGVLGARFEYDRPDHRVVLRFSGDVSASLVAGLSLVNLTTGRAVSVGPPAVQFDQANNVATLAFPGLPGGRLPDGRYRLTLRAADVVSGAGLHLDGDGDGTPGDDFAYDFFQLAGDANRDGAVGFADLVAVAQHYDQVGGATWATGDFDGDGSVGFGDLVVVAQNYDASLPGAPVSAAGLGFQGAMAAAFATVRGKPAAVISARPVPQKPVVVPKPKPAVPQRPTQVAARKPTAVAAPSRSTSSKAANVPPVPPSPVFGTRPIKRPNTAADLLA